MMNDQNSSAKAFPGRPIVVFAVGLLLGGAAGLAISGASMFPRLGEPSAENPSDQTSVTFENGTKSGVRGGDALGGLLETGNAGMGGYNRTRDVLAYVDGLKPDEIAGQIDAVFARRRGNHGYDLINNLYQKWVERDAAEALRHAEGLEGKDRRTALNAVLSAWAAKEPYEVLAWMEEHGKKSSELQSGVYSAFRTIAARDPEAAVDLYESGKWRLGAGSSASFIYAIWAEKDPQTASARALAIPNSQERTSALQSLAMQWAFENPQAAWEWGNGLEGGRDRNAVLSSVVGAVTGDGETSQAIAFLEGMAPGDARRSALQHIVSSMATSDPEAAYEFARSQVVGGKDEQVYSSLLYQWARVDPARAFEVALNELDPGNSRNSAIQSIISEVANRDVALAREMLKQVDGEILRDSVYSVAGALARNDIDSALAWAGELPEGDAKRSAYSNVLSEWAQQDPEKALAYGLQLDNAELRRRSLDSVLRQWGNDDAVEAMTWAVKHLEAKEQEQMIPGSLIGSWVGQDAEGAADWVADLPEGNLRTQSVARLVSTWARQDLVAAGEWLKKLKPGDGRDRAAVQYSSQVFESDPEAALIWADSIQKDEDRLSQVENLARRYLQNDPEKAKRWIAKSSLPAESKEELLGGEKKQ